MHAFREESHALQFSFSFGFSFALSLTRTPLYRAHNPNRVVMLSLSFSVNLCLFSTQTLTVYVFPVSSNVLNSLLLLPLFLSLCFILKMVPLQLDSSLQLRFISAQTLISVYNYCPISFSPSPLPLTF